MREPRDRERYLAAIMKQMEKEGISEPAEMIEFVNRVQERIEAGEDLPAFEPETELEQAQALIYEAFDTFDEQRRIVLAKRALKISPDCADAYVILAEESAVTASQARDLYRSGVEAGERALGPEAFEEFAGQFWEVMEARPYMRSLEGLAECERQLGEYEQAVAHFQCLLTLDQIDNMQVRYSLLGTLLEAENTNGARVLLRKFKDDDTAAWAYGRALVTFLEHGNNRQSRAQLQEALLKNIYFPAILFGVRPMPVDTPDYVEAGTEDDAATCIIEQGNAWLNHPDALTWMSEFIMSSGP